MALPYIENDPDQKGVSPLLNGEFPAINVVSNFVPPHALAELILRDGIIDSHESPADMITRVAKTLFAQEYQYDLDPKSAQALAVEFVELCDARKIIMGTPIMSNAGRHIDAPLSACSVLPVDFERDPEIAIEYMRAYHKRGIGLGIPLDDYEHPLAVARKINDVVLQAAADGEHERRIGNMATISVYHSNLDEIIGAKLTADEEGYEWRFNFSIDCDEAFMLAVKENRMVTRRDGSKVNARDLLYKISSATASCADPGLIFLDRLEQQNPTPAVGKVKSTPPCAEMGLIEGEACQFGYLNLGEFINEENKLDLAGLRRATYLVTRALDNALDISIENLDHPSAGDVMRKKRKIGVGVCGLADMLAKLDLPYNSQEARDYVEDITAFINYTSKLASVELAEKRGPAQAMKIYRNGVDNRHYAEKALLHKYAKDTKYVSATDWFYLIERIVATQDLRNSTTTAYPPTGRSSNIIGASNGVEPLFTVLDLDGNVHPVLKAKLEQRGLWNIILQAEILEKKTVQKIDLIPSDLKEVFITATEMDPIDHLLMAAAIQRQNDESISKTINTAEGTTAEQIFEWSLLAHDLGLCGVTFYPDKSRKNQPKSLAS